MSKHTNKTRSAVAEAINGGPRDTSVIPPLCSRVVGTALGYMLEMGVRLYQRIVR